MTESDKIIDAAQRFLDKRFLDNVFQVEDDLEFQAEAERAQNIGRKINVKRRETFLKLISDEGSIISFPDRK